MPLLIVPVLVVLAVIAVIPVALIQRYRVGTSRQRARGWIVAINLAGIASSAILLLTSAAVTSIWVPDAFKYTAAGLATGCVLGVAGLRLTRWDPSAGNLYFTPNRWLVLGITLLVAARLMLGFWRGWHAWRAGIEAGSWLAAAGVSRSMGAGAVVVGYYLAYWTGVRRRISRHSVPLRR